MRDHRKKRTTLFSKPNAADSNENTTLVDKETASSVLKKKRTGILITRIKNQIDNKRALDDVLTNQEKTIRSSQNYFIIDNITLYIIATVCAGSYLAGLLKYVGIPPEINGIILAIPVLAGIFQILGAIVSQKLHSQKRFVVFGTAIYRICLSIVFLFPLFFGPTLFCALMIVIVYSIGYFVGTAISPASSNWIVNLVPVKNRGDYFSRRERLSLIGIAVTTIVVSVILDNSKAADLVSMGFAAVGILLLAVAIIDISYMAKAYEPESTFEKKKFAFRTLLDPVLDKKFFKVIIIYVLWQVSTQISVPYLGIYYIDTIKMSYTFIGTVTLIVTIEKALIVKYWGKYADRTSWDHVLKIAMIFYSIYLTMQIFLSSTNYTWLYPAMMIVGNVAWSVLGIALFNIQFQFINHEKVPIYIGVCGAISGITGFAMALVGSRILKTVNAMSLPFNGYQVLIFIAALVGFLLSLYIHKKVK